MMQINLILLPTKRAQVIERDKEKKDDQNGGDDQTDEEPDKHRGRSCVCVSLEISIFVSLLALSITFDK